MVIDSDPDVMVTGPAGVQGCVVVVVVGAGTVVVVVVVVGFFLFGCAAA
jgi:hypothetical protein